MYGNVYVARLKANGALYALKKISNFFEDEQHVYLVMEYMEEGSLFEKMQKRSERMNEKETALIIL